MTDVTIGLDPDLYPLLASTQTVTGASNVIGVQDPVLDALLTAARAPGTPEARLAAYAALQVQLAKGRYLLPLAFQDEVVGGPRHARRTRSSARSPTRRTDSGMC